jgi:predicted DsbA family dithiol-disulfide isomerase
MAATASDGAERDMATVEVFADVWCPFAHVGIQRWLARRNQAGRDDVRLRVYAWPLERVNNQKLSADHVRDEVQDLRQQVDMGDLFAGFSPERFPSTTIPALLLTDRAYEVSEECGELVALELRDRLWERGQDISQPELLSVVAADHDIGLPARWKSGDAAERDWARGKARGVQGSPHFFAGATDVFCPSLKIERVGPHHLSIEDTEARFEELCEESFTV